MTARRDSKLLDEEEFLYQRTESGIMSCYLIFIHFCLYFVWKEIFGLGEWVGAVVCDLQE